MTLKYSNDEITDEELRELNLQTAAQQYMMESDAQQKTTPIPFQTNQSPLRQVSMNEHYIPDGQNTQLSQIVQKQPAQLLDGTPGIRLQIPYLEEFFGTTWYLIHVKICLSCMLFMILFLQRSHILLSYSHLTL